MSVVETKLMRAAVIGSPISHSLSPMLYLHAARACGLELAYDRIEAQPHTVEAVIELAMHSGYSGLNVTAPLKLAAATYVDELCGDARTLGCVNTICLERGRSRGHNTDALGIAYMLDHYLPAALRSSDRAVVLGAGGAARAAVLALTRHGCEKITLLARSSVALASFPATLAATPIDKQLLDTPEAAAALADARLIINATSAGMRGSELDSPLSGFPQLRAEAVLFDLIYAPPTTRLMAQARNVGALAVGGLPMLAAQAACSFALWAGSSVAVESLADHLRERGYGD